MEKLFLAYELSSLENFGVPLPEDAKIIQGTFDTMKLQYEKINEFSSQLWLFPSSPSPRYYRGSKNSNSAIT